MQTPDFQDLPLATKSIFDKEERFELKVDSDSIASPDYVTIFDRQEGEEYLIPAELIPFIANNGMFGLNIMNEEKIKAKILSNHPSHFGELDFVGASNRILVPARGSLKIELTPIISWHYDNKTQWQGWRMYLVGAEKLILSKAEWHDASGIKSMAQAMSNAKSLFTMVALTDQELAKKLSSRRVAASMKKDRSIPKMEISDLRKIIVDANLTSKDPKKSWTAGGFGNLPIKVNGKDVKIAIKIRRPDEPIFIEEPFVMPEDTPLSERMVLKQVNEQAVNNEWMTRFMKAIKDTDWRIIDLRDPDKNKSRYRDIGCFWVTRISEEDWRDLEIAAMDAASKSVNTPSKF